MNKHAMVTARSVRPRHFPRSSPGPAVGAVCFAVLAGCSAVFAAVVLLRADGGLVGWPWLIIQAVMMLLLPVGRAFSQRILLSAVAVAGTAPFMWWVPGRVPYLDRGTLLLGLTAAALAGTIIYTVLRGLSFRRFVPEFRSVDALPLAAAAVSAWVVQNLLFTKSLESTLVLLTRSWDYAPHFNMFQMIRHHGSVIAILPAAADGSQWSAASYPQGYHALLASLAEIVAGSVGDTAQESILFLRLVGAVTILGTVMVVSSMTSLPVFRRGLLPTLPFVVLAVTAWTLGPGAIPVFGAFPNFALAVALCVAIISLAHQRRLANPIVTSMALILALTAVAHGWILLLALCVPSGLIYLSYLLSRRPAMDWKAQWIQVLLIGFGAAGVLGAVWQLRKLSAEEVLTATGGIAKSDPGVAVLIIMANALVILALYAQGRRSLDGSRNRALPSLVVLATPVYAAALLIVLGAYQLASAGEISYYFYKSFLAVELVAILCAVIGAGELLIPRIVRLRRRTLTAASLLASLAVTHFFGLPYTALDGKGLNPTAFGPKSVLQQREALSDAPPPLIGKLAAMANRENGRPYVYAGYDAGYNPQLTAQWSLALQGAWTEGAHRVIPMMKPLYTGPNRVPDAIAPILDALPDIDVMVDPEFVGELRAWRPQDAHRIITWAQE